jgi:hypothetical protein
MEEWEEWECKTATNAFPCLQNLSIKNCPNLRENLPEKLPCLLNLEIFLCEQLVASIPWTPSIRELHLNDCGNLLFDYHPSTLKILKIGGYCMEASLLERIEPIISNIYLEGMKIVGCPNMNIPIHSCYNFLVGLYIWSSCDSLTTFPLDYFPKLKELQFRACNNLEMISQYNIVLGCFVFINRTNTFFNLSHSIFILPHVTHPCNQLDKMEHKKMEVI